MKIKTADLIGPALDWAVAKCEAVEVEYINDGITRCILRVTPFTGLYHPSTDWTQGGPLVEKEKVCLSWMNNFGAWHAQLGDEAEFNAYGPTPLIAAMRCVVAANLGDEIDVPDELV